MPYLTKEESNAVERVALARQDYRNTESSVRSISPEERRTLLARAVDDLTAALKAGKLCLAGSLGEKVTNLNTAIYAVEFAERSAAIRRAMPVNLPAVLPLGAAVAFGEHHGKRFTDAALLRREMRVNSMNMREELDESYHGTIGGRVVRVPALYVDWTSFTAADSTHHSDTSTR